ncbi:SDR family oxidoreductase [Zhouia sp. PK063]|uniref:SDR family oxidoreductase n=1 Tax=Zhouia sp. PK063 TaxID=3373602 RepID=UPI0037BA009F
MKVFVTGASGFVGSAVVKDLLENGYEVLGLARSDASAKKIQKIGAEVHRGDLTDIPSLEAAVAKVDGVIHTAFNHDFTRFQKSCEEERTAILAMGNVLKDSNRPFVITAAAGAIATGNLVNENDRGKNKEIPRYVSEQVADELATQNLNISVVRLSPSVHGEGDTHGFVPTLVNLAKSKGKLAYIENGMNAWAAVHRLDAAPVYRLAMQKKAVPGTRYHAVAESKIFLKDLTGLLSKKMNLPLVALSKEEASDYFGGFLHFASLHIPISSKQTQESLEWQPTHPALFEDIENNVYF